MANLLSILSMSTSVMMAQRINYTQLLISDNCFFSKDNNVSRARSCYYSGS